MIAEHNINTINVVAREERIRPFSNNINHNVRV